MSDTPITLSDRLRLAWSVITDSKAQSAMLPTWQVGKPAPAEVNFERLVRSVYRRNELIFACSNRLAGTAAYVSVDVIDKRDDSVIEDHPIAKLLQRPNSAMDAADFWRSVIQFQQMAGNAYYEIIRNNFGDPIELWPLRPDWVKPIRSNTEFISGYSYEVPGARAARIERDDVLDFKLFDPLNMYRGYPPMAVAAVAAGVDSTMTDYLSQLLEQGGTPPGLLKTSQKLLEDDVTELRARWQERYGGVNNWHSVAVLDMDAEYQRIGLSFDELGFDSLDARSEARICMVMQVPAILVQAKIGLDRSTFSNYGESRASWWEDTLIPLYLDFLNVLQNQLTAPYGDSIELRFNFERVPSLAESRDAVFARAVSAATAGIMTRNEARAELGLEGDPEGDIYIDARNATDESAPLQVGHPGAAHERSHGKADHPEAPEDDAERMAYERQLRKDLERYFKGQRSRLREHLESTQPKAQENGHHAA